jgi:hypothetical protein
MQPTLIAFRQWPNSWRKMLRLSLLALAALNPPAFLLAQNRPVKFERIGMEQGLSQNTVYYTCKTGKDLCGLARRKG